MLYSVALPIAMFAASSSVPTSEPTSQPTAITDIEQLSLDDLLNPKVEIATKTALTAQDTPGIITVITRDEIVHSGAVYLMDLLQLVPGFSFGVDVEGVVGVGFRGMWGHEGKVLFLVDGLEMNENQYATMPLGHHIPVDHIERVEIIRGPGSAIYGGYAELAVVSVITREGKDLNGLALQSYYGHETRGVGRASFSASAGRAFDNGLDVSVKAFAGIGNRSDDVYTDYAGNSYSMLGDSQLTQMTANAAVSYRGFKARLLYDDHSMRIRDGFGPVEPVPADQGFRSIFADLRYELKITDSLRLIPRLSYKYQRPWDISDTSSPLYTSASNHRLLGNVILSWDILPSLNLLVGLEGYWDRGWLDNPLIVGLATRFGDALYVNYGDFASYAQMVFLNFICNVTVGLRYEFHSAFGSSFVPRIALTKTVDRFNFKALFGQAFRAPAIQNLNINPELKPERTNTVEAEVGVRITENMQLSVNAFWGRIDKAIVYGVTTKKDPETGEDLETEAYFNGTYTGTAGVEAVYRFKYPWGHLALTYSFYSSAHQNDMATYAVPGNDAVLLGMPAHKVTLNSSFNLYQDHLVLGVSGAFLSERYGYLSVDADGNGVIGTLPPQLFVNVMLFYRNLGIKGLDVGAGVLNVGGQTYKVIQPYNGGHPPLPLGSRELFVRVGYTHSFD